MRVRRALTIAIATPVLLAAIGMNGASAASPPKPSADGSTVRSEPTADKGRHETSDRKHGRIKMDPEEEMEGGLIGNIAGELLGRS
ncbi:hypothetical protein ACFV98_09845 [Streptomyces violascens]|uniref:hypothetical protein n=1 Tax=Streptomyces violascens TaxID=67381 RepID=UPI0036494820